MSAQVTELRPSTAEALRERSMTSDTSIGEQLREARERAGLSTGQVAVALHMDTAQIDALEHDRFEHFSGAVYVKGYLRNYAKLLNLDAVALLERYQRTHTAEPPRLQQMESIMPTDSKRRVIPGTFVTLITVLIAATLLYWLGIGAYDLWQEKTALQLPNVAQFDDSPAPRANILPLPPARPPSATEVVPSATGLTLPAPEESVAGALAAAKPFPEPAATLVAAAGDPTQAMAADAATSSQEAVSPAPPLETAAPEPATAGEAGTLALKFDAESWVEVYDADDMRLMARLARPGNSHELRGRPPFRVVLGYADGVKVTYNGKSVNVDRHTQGEVARFTVGLGD